MAALEDAYPGLLEKILGQLAIAGQVQQVAEEAVLVLLDEAVEHIRIAALQAEREGLRVVVNHRGEKEPRQLLAPSRARSLFRYGRYEGCAHSTWYTDEQGEKTRAWPGGKGS